VVVDSASPVKPELGGDPAITWIELTHNPGHALDCTERLCGYTVSVMMAAHYTYLCGADYLVYVEQDNLLVGEGIIERAIACMTTPFMFGDPVARKQPLQQSLFIVRRDGLLPLVSFLNRLATPDRELSPERKFGLAAFAAAQPPLDDSAAPLLAAHLYALEGLIHAPDSLPPARRNFDWLPFGYGRNRPIDWEQRHFYLQHASADELTRYLARTGFSF